MRSLGRLICALEALIQAKLPVTAPESDAAREADLAVDNGSRVLNSWLYAWTLMPEGSHPLLPRAQPLFSLLFGDGMKFINESHLVEWQESQYRLEAIARDGHGATIDALGGLALLEQLIVVQKRYGEALGITRSSEPVPAKRYRAQLEAVGDACREYVGRVALYPDPEIPGSDVLARTLLEPIERWEIKKVTPKGSSEATAPAAAPAAKATDAAPLEG